MLRQLLRTALVVFAIAGLVQDAHGKGRCCRGGVAHYLFGGCGPGPFGHGYFPYAGWYQYGDCLGSSYVGYAGQYNYPVYANSSTNADAVSSADASAAQVASGGALKTRFVRK